MVASNSIGSEPLKRSRYTLLFPSFDESAILFNTFSGSLSVLGEEAAKTVHSVLWRPNFPYKKAQFLEAKRELEQRGHLLPESRDELTLMALRHRQGRKDRSEFGLTLAPTGNCNLRCVYCYQGEHGPLAWSEQIERAVVDFVRHRLPRGATFSVTWYGGEPLLALDAVLRTSQVLRDLAEQRNCSWQCEMVTNGLLLSPGAVRSLAEIDCREFQVSLDGPRQVHDRMRPTKQGQGSFDVILKNLEALHLDRIHVGLRVNVTKNNVETVPGLLEYLARRGLAQKLTLSLAPVEALTRSCAGIAHDCLDTPDFADWHFQTMQFMDKLGFSTESLPLPVTNHCGADREYSYVIDWRGDVYKCWNEVGHPEFSIGSVLREEDIRTKGTCWDRWDPMHDQECRNCPLLPVCLGGCPPQALTSASQQKRCLYMKYRFADYLNFHVLKTLRLQPESPSHLQMET